MLHNLFALTRPLFILDTETTGTNDSTDRIIEIGFQEWTADGMVKEWRTLVNPGVPIPTGATKVHGITDEVVTGCRDCGKLEYAHNPAWRLDTNQNLIEIEQQELLDGRCAGFRPWPRFADLAPNLAKGLTACDFGGKRIRFDLRILAASFVRAKVAWSYAEARIVDADRLEQIAIPRTLSDLYEKYTGKPHEGAHGVLLDVRASTAVLEGQLEVPAVLPRDLDALHQMQWADWIDPGGKFKFVDGVPTMMFGKHRGQTMASVPKDYWDFILNPKNNFEIEAKAYAADAKLGTFPERT